MYKMFHDCDDIEEIQGRLLEIQIDKEIILTRKLLKQVLHASSCGVDTLAVFPTVAKLLASNDLIIKKLASWYVSQHGNHPDFILLVINTLLKDCQDPNPMTRGHALKTLTGLPLPSVVEYCLEPVNSGLRDGSAFVRRAAVVACMKLHRLNPELVVECGWVDALYGLIRDSDPVVVTNCLCGLEDILRLEGGMVCSRSMAHHLLNKLGIFNDLHVAVVLKVLKKYKPRSEEETLDIMNVVDDHLKSNSANVVLESLNYFIFLIKGMPHLRTELYSRSKVQIDHFLGSANPELVYVLLEFVESLLAENVDFLTNYKTFFCKYNEPAYLKKKKIILLPHVATEENVKEILDELNMYSTDVDTSVATASVQAIGSIAHKIPEFCQICLNRLFMLLELHPPKVTDEILCILQDLDLNKSENIKHSLELIKLSSEYIETDSSHCAVISIFGHYGEYLDDSLYVLEDYIQDLDQDSSITLLVSLLSATTKLFLKRPAECQEMLGKLLEICVTSKCVEVRDRGLFFYQLLKTDVQEAKKVLHIDKS